jgi:hypothetical protein
MSFFEIQNFKLKNSKLKETVKSWSLEHWINLADVLNNKEVEQSSNQNN